MQDGTYPLRLMAVAATDASGQVGLRQRTLYKNSTRFCSFDYGYKVYKRKDFEVRFKGHLQTARGISGIYSSDSSHVHVIDFTIHRPDDGPSFGSVEGYKFSLMRSLNQMLARKCKKVVIGFYTDEKPFLVESA